MNKKLTILADENMPHIDTLFGNNVEIKRAPGRYLKKDDLKGVDALLCRSITQVDRTLLEGTPVKFVGTATIGIDHLDIDFLNSFGIQWANAAGCNAEAVAQYVMSGLALWANKNNQSIKSLTLGIVGAGNVGTAVAKYCDWLGIRYQLCDPPLAEAGDSRDFVSFETASQCDVVTFHVPMEKSGAYPTFHMVNQAWLENLKPSQLVINASRGGVIDNAALNQYLDEDDVASVILDVFENEPDVNYELVQKVLVATPHIAGHTLEGKSRGSYMVYQAACQALGIDSDFKESDLYPEPNQLEESSLSFEDKLLAMYNIEQDGLKLKNVSKEQLVLKFDELRKGYVESFRPVPRRDYSGWVFNDGLVSDESFWPEHYRNSSISMEKD